MASTIVLENMSALFKHLCELIFIILKLQTSKNWIYCKVTQRIELFSLIWRKSRACLNSLTGCVTRREKFIFVNILQIKESDLLKTVCDREKWIADPKSVLENKSNNYKHYQTTK